MRNYSSYKLTTNNQLSQPGGDTALIGKEGGRWALEVSSIPLPLDKRGEPPGVQRVHTDLLATPFPRPGLGINARVYRARAARRMRENGKVERLAKRVKMKFWAAEARKGR